MNDRYICNPYRIQEEPIQAQRDRAYRNLARLIVCAIVIFFVIGVLWTTVPKGMFHSEQTQVVKGNR